MDTNSKNNNEFINEKKNTSKGIIATLVAIAIIVVAACGMIKAYPLIAENAEKVVKPNYFEDYNDFSYKLSETAYGAYFNTQLESGKDIRELYSIDEEALSREFEENYYYDYDFSDEMNSNKEEYISERRADIEENIYYLARQIESNDSNLEFAVYDNENNKSLLRNTSENVSITNDGVTFNKEDYQFYAIVNFDEEGKITITDIYGAERDRILENLKNRMHYYNSGGMYESVEVDVKNLTIFYGVPVNLQYADGISYELAMIQNYGYESVGVIAVIIIATLVALAAICFPIKKAKTSPVFRGISKIPFEIWCVIGGCTIAILVVSSISIIAPVMNENFNYFLGIYVYNIGEMKSILWAVSFIIWFVCFGVVFNGVLLLKYIFNIGVVRYIKTHTIIGRAIGFIVRGIKKTVNEVASVDLSKKNNSLIIKLLLINAIILIGISSIWFFGIPVIILYSIVLFFVIRKYVDKIIKKYSKLREATSEIAKGKLDVNIDEDLGLFEPLKEDLSKIQIGFKKAVEEEVKSQKMKTDLISNVSHDLKTPLTAIITYTELLKDENLSEEKRMEYLEILDRKSQRLQVLIEDLFEMSKATSGNITLNMESVDVVALMKQTLLELEDKIQEANLVVRKNLPKEKVMLTLDGQRTFRVFENLVINMSKYAMPGTRVYIDIMEKKNIEGQVEYVEMVMKNMAAEEITFNVDTIAERFVRGDESRNTEGSGLGLAIAKSFVELQGGKFKISVDGDLFKVYIKFSAH